MYGPPMWKAFQRYRKLDPEARRLFWRAVVLLPWVAYSLRVRGFQRTRENLARRVPNGPSNTARDARSAEVAQITSRMVRAGARHGPAHPSCLEQSLVLWFLMAREGVPARLRIGVKKSAGKFEAHAWVEYDGVPLNQSEEVHHHYAAFEGEFSDVSGESR